MNRNNRKKRRFDNVKNRVIKRQLHEIESLKRTISNLEIDNKKKDEIIDSIESFRLDLFQTLKDIEDKSEEYDVLIEGLKQMREVFNQEVFKGRWKIIKWLMK